VRFDSQLHRFGRWFPEQKYDVIHYIRETYLKDRNPSQYSRVDAGYLAKLPQGDTRGPAPSRIEPWSAMDYGPWLTHTYEVPGKGHNFAYKGIAIRLDPGAGGVARGKHWMLFDEDTLRVAAAWNAQDQPKTGGETPDIFYQLARHTVQRRARRASQACGATGCREFDRPWMGPARQRGVDGQPARPGSGWQTLRPVAA